MSTYKISEVEGKVTTVLWTDIKTLAEAQNQVASMDPAGRRVLVIDTEMDAEITKAFEHWTRSRQEAEGRPWWKFVSPEEIFEAGVLFGRGGTH